ncbi:MAG: ATP-binding protein [Bullifex sp.]
MIRQEMRDPSQYNTIIQTVAAGKTRFSDIQTFSMMEKSKLSVYLGNLTELGIIEKEYPLKESKSSKANPQRGLYKIKDRFFRFWYRYVYPYRSALEFGNTEPIYDRIIRPTLNEFASDAFEAICMEWLHRQNSQGSLPFLFTGIGRWWNGRDEIDILATGADGKIISCE